VTIDKFSGFFSGPGVYVRTGPDFLTRLIVEDNTLAHAGAAHAPDRVRCHSGDGEKLPDTGADRLPVGMCIEYLGAGICWLGEMRPFPLGHSHLSPGWIKE